jgi:hypothetical protein
MQNLQSVQLVCVPGTGRQVQPFPLQAVTALLKKISIAKPGISNSSSRAEMEHLCSVFGQGVTAFSFDT